MPNSTLRSNYVSSHFSILKVIIFDDLVLSLPRALHQPSMDGIVDDVISFRKCAVKYNARSYLSLLALTTPKPFDIKRQVTTTCYVSIFWILL